jgi:hypothetical protein
MYADCVLNRRSGRSWWRQNSNKCGYMKQRHGRVAPSSCRPVRALTGITAWSTRGSGVLLRTRHDYS